VCQDIKAPAGAVDLKEFPGRFCLWIPKDWQYVSNVFSCRLKHLRCDTGIPYLRRVLQMLCTPSHTVPHREGQTSVVRLSVWEQEFTCIDFVPDGGSVSIKGLVELPADAHFSRRTPQVSDHSFIDSEGEYTWQ
jgi:hypothetical protein